MVIGLARIDDRLIHGQVATRWTKANVTRIIVVSDEVAADTVRKTLLTPVYHSGVTAHVVDVAKMIRVYNNPKYMTIASCCCLPTLPTSNVSLKAA